MDESFDFLATVDLGETATTCAVSFFLSFLFNTKEEGIPMAGAAALLAKEVVPPPGLPPGLPPLPPASFCCGGGWLGFTLEILQPEGVVLHMVLLATLFVIVSEAVQGVEYWSGR